MKKRAKIKMDYHIPNGGTEEIAKNINILPKTWIQSYVCNWFEARYFIHS
jgi:hypothetical protein